MSGQNLRNKKPDVEIEVGGDVADSIIVTGDGNVINVIQEEASSALSKKKTHPKRPPKNKIPLTVAWIGFVATILAALIAVYGDSATSPSLTGVASLPTSTLTLTPVPTPTNTATLIPVTATPIPVIDTPTIVPTFTVFPPVPIMEDWKAGCISTLWRAYPSTVSPVEKGNGCWKEPVHVFSAENGDLDFLSERGNGSAEIYGLFAPLPESGTVTFSVRLKHLENADLWMGVFAEPNLDSQGLLLTILNGGVSKRSIVQKDPHTYATIQGTQVLSQGNGFLISFTVTPLSVSGRVNPHVFVWDPVSIPSPQKWIFLGYKGLRNAYHIEGTFLNFEVTP